MQRSLNAYLNGMLTNEEVIAEMLKLAKQIAADRQEGEKLGLTADELAFYDALVKPQAIKDFYENCLSNDRPILVQIKENGDKYKDFYYPILKNYLEDIIVFDINGNLYKNTGKYRKLCFQSSIKKIDLYEPDSICFNPLSYLNLENIKDFTDVLVMNCLGETERTNKVKFLSAVIKQFYFEIRIKELDLDINFKTILYRSDISDENCYDDIELINNITNKNLKIVIDCGYVPQASYQNVANKCIARIDNLKSIITSPFSLIPA